MKVKYKVFLKFQSKSKEKRVRRASPYFLVKPAHTGKSYIIHRIVSLCSTNQRTHIYSQLSFHINPLAFKPSQFLTLIEKLFVKTCLKPTYLPTGLKSYIMLLLSLKKET